MSLYQEIILDHYHNPRHHGTLEHASHAADAKNLSCGDELHMDIFAKEGIIKDIAFQGTGCAISQASASLLCEHVVGESIVDAEKLSKEDILDLLGIDALSPNRLKCALLSLETLHKTLKQTTNDSQPTTV